MATIGVRYPYVARYNYDPVLDQVTYSGGRRLAKAVEYSAKIDASEDNIMYADDMDSESASTFAGGEMTITTDDLEIDGSALILGASMQQVEVGDKQYQEITLDDTAVSPYLGFGLVIPRQRNGVRSYRAVVWHKVKFSIPEEAAKTMADKIEWQTPKLTANIYRSDAPKHPVKSEIIADTVEEAVDYIKDKLSIVDLKALSVVSSAGTSAGKTKITVTPDKDGSNTYKYKTGKTVAIPEVGNNTEDWSPWAGTTEEITATTGDQIVIVEVDAAGQVVGAGRATVTSAAE